jgi:hypothetical protein
MVRTPLKGLSADGRVAASAAMSCRSIAASVAAMKRSCDFKFKFKN